jgi:hypothetical protein
MREMANAFDLLEQLKAELQWRKESLNLLEAELQRRKAEVGRFQYFHDYVQVFCDQHQVSTRRVDTQDRHRVTNLRLYEQNIGPKA